MLTMIHTLVRRLELGRLEDHAALMGTLAVLGTTLASLGVLLI